MVLEPLRRRTQPLVELSCTSGERRARGPRIVAIGGGTGLSTLLRGLKEVTSNITAVVTVADDGGSSGRLRDELGVPPMGDIRNCIAALADAEPRWRDLLQYRFPTERARTAGLSGHAFGNLLIAALTDHRAATSRRACASPTGCSRCAGQVVPVAPMPLTLHAELADGSTTGRPVADHAHARHPPRLDHPRRRRERPTKPSMRSRPPS